MSSDNTPSDLKTRRARLERFQFLAGVGLIVSVLVGVVQGNRAFLEGQDAWSAMQVPFVFAVGFVGVFGRLANNLHPLRPQRRLPSKVEGGGDGKRRSTKVMDKEITIGVSRDGRPQGIEFRQIRGERSPYIELWAGAKRGHANCGALATPEELLTRYRSVLEDTNSEWFVPMLEAMAEGRRFSDDEIIAEYARNHGGAMPEIEEVRPERPVNPNKTGPLPGDSRPVV